MLVSMDGLKVYLAAGHSDLRKSIDGLSVLVSEGFQLDPFSPSFSSFATESAIN